ncbi:alpha/beta hydrolase [Rhodococcoides trifolii]|uniref:Alpha/beta hydrolase n=1 Tax=Rhodococcoides trifolii TaxID=908250 RepID=A0A917FNN4_9NOCA|nr:alpha/beta fold hydrolase [Rhodococcus trifolii]GGF93316.1 alpha/beta hydrolase [Rhodococcus trifolii]
MDFATNPVDGTRIFHTTTGAGPPVLLVHGSLLSHQIWRTFGYVRALRDTHRLILVDQRGHGRSDKPRDVASYSMDLITGDLLAVLDATDTETVDYVGYSFGGRSGLHLASRAPHRLRSLIAGGASAAPQKGALDGLFFPNSADVLEHRGMDAFIEEWSKRRIFPVDSGTRAAFMKNDPLALAAYFRASDADPGLPDSALTSMSVPTMMFVGTEDTARIDDTRRAAALIPGADLHEIRGYDHGTTVAAPEAVELVKAALCG